MLSNYIKHSVYNSRQIQSSSGMKCQLVCIEIFRSYLNGKVYLCISHMVLWRIPLIMCLTALHNRVMLCHLKSRSTAVNLYEYMWKGTGHNQHMQIFYSSLIWLILQFLGFKTYIKVVLCKIFAGKLEPMYPSLMHTLSHLYIEVLNLVVRLKVFSSFSMYQILIHSVTFVFYFRGYGECQHIE